jgi:hypothetical protein
MSRDRMVDEAEQEVQSITLPSGVVVRLKRPSREFQSEWLLTLVKEVVVRPDGAPLDFGSGEGIIWLFDLDFIVRWALSNPEPGGVNSLKRLM